MYTGIFSSINVTFILNDWVKSQEKLSEDSLDDNDGENEHLVDPTRQGREQSLRILHLLFTLTPLWVGPYILVLLRIGRLLDASKVAVHGVVWD